MRKFSLYESAGVREFWLIDPTLESIEIWVLTASEFTLNGAYRTPQPFTSPVVNETDMPLTDIFPLPA